MDNMIEGSASSFPVIFPTFLPVLFRLVFALAFYEFSLSRHLYTISLELKKNSIFTVLSARSCLHGLGRASRLASGPVYMSF